MARLLLASFVLLAIAATTPLHAAPAPAPAVLVEQALAVQGGRAKLEAIQAVELRGIIHRQAIEQSVRPEGPYFEAVSDLTEIRRFTNPALRQQLKSRGYLGSWWVNPEWSDTASLVIEGAALVWRGGKWVPGSQAAVATAEESLALGPERILLTALAAGDLQHGASATLHGYAHDTLRFSYHGAQVTLYLLPESHLIAAADVVRAHPLDMFLSSWGDVRTHVEWAAWTLEPNGIRYPRQWTFDVNGTRERSVLVDAVTFDPGIDARLLDAGAETIAAARRSVRPIADFPFSTSRSAEVVPGITLIQGAWNVVVVKSAEGVTLIEAPISGGFTKGALDHARALGPVRRVISTSDSWPHIAGLREAVAQGIPLILLDRNVPLVERLLAAPHISAPDSLAHKPARARITRIAQAATLGSGDAAMRLIPFHTVTGERQMAVYWPKHRLLYTSDLMSVQPTGVWLPQYRGEVAELIAREGLEVETVFGMHYAPISWDKVKALPGIVP